MRHASLFVFILVLSAIPSFTFASFDRSLSQGMRGSDVSNLQQMLATAGCFNLIPTGYFGSITFNSVKCWQGKNGLPTTGFFGPLSRAKANFPDVSTTIPTITSASSTNSFSLSGYVVYESPAGEAGCGTLPSGQQGTPCDSEYDFLIISNKNNPVDGTLPTMIGFPSKTDPNYTYVSYSGALGGGPLPNVGDMVRITGIINQGVALNPPYTFPMTATSITIGSPAGINGILQKTFGD